MTGVFRSARRSAAALALAAGLTSFAAVAEAGHSPSATIKRGLFNQGLLPSSTGLDAPPGDTRAAAASEGEGAAASVAADPPLRVYVVVVDGLLPQQIGLRTPNLNALKTGGTSWEQARAVLPAETLPNHAAMATGMVPQRNGIIANQFYRGRSDKEYMQYPEFWEADTITTRLERAYRGEIDTATILSKEYLFGLFLGEHPGPGDALAQREADFHWDPRSQPAYIGYPSSHALDVGTMDALLGWIRAEADSPRPQFAFVNLGDVDRAGHADEGGVLTAAADRASHLEDDELSELHQAPFQQTAIENTDAQIGRLVTELKDTGVWDESVLIVLSDHGMDWGPQALYFSSHEFLGATHSGKYRIVGGGGSELVYVEKERDIAPIARILCGARGVAVIATPEPVSGLDTTQCRGKTLGELGLDHRYSPEIQVFLEPGYHSDPQRVGGNPLPGNHGHGVTQHSALLVAGGHDALDPKGSIGGPRVYQRGNVAEPAGPGVLSVAPTVAGLFGIGSPVGGYDAAPLAAAFDPGVVDLNSTDPVTTPSVGGGEDDGAEARAAPAPLVTVGSDVVRASATEATSSLYVANVGDAPATGVVVTNPVPADTTFAASERQPLDPDACKAGAPAATSCRWALGELAPGTSIRFEVTYNLAQTDTQYDVSNTVSVQVGGAAPASTDPANTDATLTHTSEVVEDAHVVDSDPPDLNHGQCALLQLGADNAVTPFLDADATAAFARTGSGYGREVLAAELQATAESVSGAPVEVGAHRIVISHDWTEGSGSCAGSAGTGDDVRTGAKPVSETSPLGHAPVTTAGEQVRWDVRAALDTAQELRDFEGFELRLEGALTGRAVAFHSSEATATAARPRLVTVSRARDDARCVDADPETATRRSDENQRIRAYATDGAMIVGAGGEEACNGSPVAGAPIGWELDDDLPDAYIASLAGEPTERELGGRGDAAPNRASTITGPRGRTYIDVRLGQPYEQDQNSGAIRIAAITLKEHDGSNAPSPGEGQGTCEPRGEPLASCYGTGEGTIAGMGYEDDVVTTWEAAEPPFGW